VPRILRLTRRTETPVLQIAGEVVADSTRIIEH
jgi:hypothetical protein